MRRNGAYKIALYGLFLALALVLSWIETLLPFVFPVPGMKIGLANIVIVTMLYIAGPKEAVLLSFLRLLLVMITFGNAAAFMYSLAGALLSFLTMWGLRSKQRFSVLAVSIAGGCMHNVGQLIVAAIVLETASIAYYLPWLLVSGAVSGFAIGILGAILAGRTASLVKRSREGDQGTFNENENKKSQKRC